MSSKHDVRCPNCGSTMDLVNGQCICCWWREGEARFKPHWMDEGVWRRGVKYNWQLSDADARKLERGKKRG